MQPIGGSPKASRRPPHYGFPASASQHSGGRLPGSASVRSARSAAEAGEAWRSARSNSPSQRPPAPPHSSVKGSVRAPSQRTASPLSSRASPDGRRVSIWTGSAPKRPPSPGGGLRRPASPTGPPKQPPAGSQRPVSQLQWGSQREWRQQDRPADTASAGARTATPRSPVKGSPKGLRSARPVGSPTKGPLPPPPPLPSATRRSTASPTRSSSPRSPTKGTGKIYPRAATRVPCGAPHRPANHPPPPELLEYLDGPVYERQLRADSRSRSRGGSPQGSRTVVCIPCASPASEHSPSARPPPVASLRAAARGVSPPRVPPLRRPPSAVAAPPALPPTRWKTGSPQRLQPAPASESPRSGGRSSPLPPRGARLPAPCPPAQSWGFPSPPPAGGPRGPAATPRAPSPVSQPAAPAEPSPLAAATAEPAATPAPAGGWRPSPREDPGWSAAATAGVLLQQQQAAAQLRAAVDATERSRLRQEATEQAALARLVQGVQELRGAVDDLRRAAGRSPSPRPAIAEAPPPVPKAESQLPPPPMPVAPREQPAPGLRDLAQLQLLQPGPGCPQYVEIHQFFASTHSHHVHNITRSAPTLTPAAPPWTTPAPAGAGSPTGEQGGAAEQWLPQSADRYSPSPQRTGPCR
eukprot:TRINITY_DN5697_c0_g1_i2.p1 TRINITY_DN5697_c0_g1~~TRINITY_DN5697_c0_g1_i2.p1  ORF type:complete len:659 (+),score=118.42 TRINITY_DN5697_c0_g1_i2:64-1977(+)